MPGTTDSEFFSAEYRTHLAAIERVIRHQAVGMAVPVMTITHTFDQL